MESTTARAQEVAAEILNQLGGKSRLIVMTCASCFCLTEDLGVSFRLPSRGIKNKANMVKIELNGLDLYDVTFERFTSKTLNITEKGVFKDVHCEDLMNLFEEQTGLYLTLRPRA